ncbi:sensor histidine kinase [Sphingomonas immobilis]|uniref:histidine kinase n=1 Tax=Sphingomonas immobilis TaxID=3063997 RepID=A0ABT8ZWL2_9SPHN|nr:HWE histidine kinase domain-containing protein [Sphingomonas sp. CA1-15]MDO7841960.1 HWE histidine kinase domain-containing protein [Sphingomonas sp. CA1-15]
MSDQHATWDEGALRRAIDAAEVALWRWNVDTDALHMDARAYRLWGIADDVVVTFGALSEHIHPADRDRVGAAFNATRAGPGAYEIDFRIVLGSEIRWISARGQGGDVGMIGRLMAGIFLDVTGRKQAEEGHELLAGEMSHRVKNLLAIATGLTAITSRSARSAKDMAEQLTGRLTALGRAHDLVRPIAGSDGDAALLGDLLTVLLAPYDDEGAFAGRIRVAVPRMGIGETSATTLALVIHELATNSLKYGALSDEKGTLDVSCAIQDDVVVLIWTERGGPAVVPPANAKGFGSDLVNRSVRGQLGGSIDHDWCAEGVIVTLRLAKQRLAN